MITTPGAYGAAIATTISQAVVVLVQVYYVRKQLNVRLAFKTAKKYWVASSIMFLACCLVRMDGIMSVILKIASAKPMFSKTFLLSLKKVRFCQL